MLILFQLFHFCYALLLVNAQEDDDGQFCDPDVPSRPLNLKTALLLSSANLIPCGAGRYYNQSQLECLPCPQGSFMTQLMSDKRYTACLPCLQISNKLEVISEACRATRDTTIMCLNAFFRKREQSLPCATRCTRCKICGTGLYLYQNYELRPCGGYNDTICCQSRDMVIVNDVCRPRQTPAPQRHEYNGATELRHHWAAVVALVTLFNCNRALTWGGGWLL